MSYILAIDQGTTSSRVFIYNSKLERVGFGQNPFQQYFPKPGWVEHDLDEIWSSVRQSIEVAIASVKDSAWSVKKIAAIGITNQRETFGLWDRSTSKVLGRAIVWQDRRSSELCAKLKKLPAGRAMEKKSGLVLDPYFSGTKLSLKLHEVNAKNAAFGTIDTFLLWKLTQGKSHATDTSNASRTLLMDIEKLAWNKDACKLLKIPMDLLPEIKSSDAEFGKTRGLGILPDGIPIHGILGDQQAALFGQGCWNVGDAKITYGTGAFMLVNTGKKIIRRKGALSTVAWTLKDETLYALETSVFIAGAAVQWLRDGLKMFAKSSEVEDLAKTVSSSDGVFFIPALSGLGSPYWVPEARGIIGGLTRGSTRAHLARASLEGIAHSVADTFASIDMSQKKSALRVDGGASQDSLLMQMQSDLLQRSLERPNDVETTVRGAASIAALGVKMTSLEELKKFRLIDAIFAPKLSKHEALEKKSLWSKRIKMLIAFSKLSTSKVSK